MLKDLLLDLENRKKDVRFFSGRTTKVRVSPPRSLDLSGTYFFDIFSSIFFLDKKSVSGSGGLSPPPHLSC